MTIGVLCIHGFSGGVYEVQPLVEYLKQETNWIFQTPTLSGHGEAKSLNLKGYKASHWLKDAELSYMDLAKRVDEVIVIGFSMGGLIALYLARRFKVKKLVLLSPAAKYIHPMQIFQDVKTMAVDAYRRTLNENELFKRYQYKLKNVPLSATFEFMKIVKMITPYFYAIKTPVYIVQGQLDGIVPYHTAQYVFDRLGSQEKHLYFSENGKHHICFSNDCDVWFPLVRDFLQKDSEHLI